MTMLTRFLKTLGNSPNSMNGIEMESRIDSPKKSDLFRGSFLSGLVLCLIFLGQEKVLAESSIEVELSAQPSVEEIFRARIFDEPLVPVGGNPSHEENAALAKSLRAFMARADHDDASALEAFLTAYPSTKWKASVLCNLGLVYYRTGAFTKALDAWSRAWELSKNESGESGRAVADRAVGEYAKMIARLGRVDRLESLLAEVGNRDIRGPSTEKIQGAREALVLMKTRPSESFLCGPLALTKIFGLMKPGTTVPDNLRNFVSTNKGTSLWQVRTEAKQSGLNYEAVKRTLGTPLLLPAIINWKVGHYAAVVGFENGSYHLQDPTFGDDVWVSPRILDAEASGYFLVPAGKLPAHGWTVVGKNEASEVWGKGVTGSSDPSATGPNNGKTPPGCPGSGMPDGSSSGSSGGLAGSSSSSSSQNVGMPGYQFHLQLISLNLTDIPVGYAPPRGPRVQFKLTYNQREANQPSIFNYGNLGNKWTHDWLTYLTDDPAAPSANIDLFNAGGGSENYNGYNSTTSSYLPSLLTQAILVRTATSPVKYQRKLPDGSIEYYEKVDGATSFPRRIFLTKITDAVGQSITYAYDAQFRLTSVTDALGQVTTLSYALAADPLKVTKVTDPFGRFATLDYNASNQLMKITDVLGLATTFTYAAGDFISSMTTPYGTTSFRSGSNNANGSGNIRWGEVTDPLGNRERLEFHHTSPQIPSNAPEPAGFPAFSMTNEASTMYWDKKAMADGILDYTKAKSYIWARSGPAFHVSSAIMVSEQKALESRIWYHYFNQGASSYLVPGMWDKPDQIGRLMDDGSTQTYLYDYNSNANITKITDPMNRITTYGYAANGIDLLTVRQTTAGTNQLLETYTYNAIHLPLTKIDAAGQKTTYTYNAQGQLLSLTNAKNEATTYTYNASGYLLKIQGPQVPDSTIFAYDTFGRVKSKRAPDGYLIQYAYDAMNRITKVTYPDGTFEQRDYNRLDLETTTDRLGRATKTYHNAIRQPVTIQDPLQRLTNLEWCACGEMKTLIDPAGNKTQWKRDVQGRVIEKTFADGKKMQFTYENSTSRLKSWTDAKTQVATYTYFNDNDVNKVVYTNAAVATASVSHTYDTQFNRLKTMVDGTGTTTYNYNAITATPAIGAGRLANIDGPLANDIIAFTYDQLGRVVTRGINASNSTVVYDNLGRTTSVSNPLGSFTYKYVSMSTRLDSLIYPNGQKTAYTYFPNTGDFRLQEIKNLTPALASLSKLDYTYDVESQIKTWTQQADAATASIHNFTYDPTNQINSDVVKSAATGNPVQKSFAYVYDKAGNRTSSQETGVVNSFSYNSVNQLTSEQSGGKMRFFGTLNEAATVTINGQPTPVSGNKEFDGSAAVVSGTNTVTVTAKDYSNNSTTTKYQVSASGAAKTITYDNNGNMTGDGTYTFEWDAENRLTAVVKGALRSEFTYDGLSRRVRIVEKNGTTVTSDKRFLWVENEIAEERDATGATVTKRYYPSGVLIGTTKYFYTRDHLGSIKEMTDNTGAIAARYEYDAYGTRTKVSGTLESDLGFTGHFFHVPSGLYLTKYRAYNPAIGRWISRDPIGEISDPNLYRYVFNNVPKFRDPNGDSPGFWMLVIVFTCIGSQSIWIWMNGPETSNEPNPWEKHTPAFGKDSGNKEDSIPGGEGPPGPDGEWEPKFEGFPRPVPVTW